MTELNTLFEHFDTVAQDDQQGVDGLNAAEDVDDGPITAGDIVFDDTEYGYGVVTSIDETTGIATLRVSSPRASIERGTAVLEELERVPVERMPTYSTTPGSVRDMYQ